MTAKPAHGMSVAITKDGPYVVTGGVPLSKQEIAGLGDESADWRPVGAVTAGATYSLCRCGQSARKPFCDGSHARVRFDGEETASRQPYRDLAQEIDGPVLALTDAESLCAFARFCDRDGGIWNNVPQAQSEASAKALAHEAGQCPSGRLVAWNARSGEPIEPALPPSIVLVEDPHQGVSGPIWVRGGIAVVGADGAAYEVRNRVTLCRCGQSKNKPFCDGTHASIGFTDAPS